MKLEWNPAAQGTGESPPAGGANGAAAARAVAGGTAAAGSDAIGISAASTALGQLSASMVARVGGGSPAPAAAIARSIVQSAIRG